jgi:hypothetical protein
VAALNDNDNATSLHMRYWLGITEHVMREANDRFNRQVDVVTQLRQEVDQLSDNANQSAEIDNLKA